MMHQKTIKELSALLHSKQVSATELTQHYLDRVAASHLMGQVVRYDIGNVFDPAYTVACRIARKWLPPRK